MSDPQSTYGEDPHPFGEEDPESLAGERIPDPWEDDAQEDWPNEQVNSDG